MNRSTKTAALFAVLVAVGFVVGLVTGNEYTNQRVLGECKRDGGFRLYVSVYEYFYYCGYVPQGGGK